MPDRTGDRWLSARWVAAAPRFAARTIGCGSGCVAPCWSGAESQRALVGSGIEAQVN
ncbi:hypothetical protein GLP06_24315, partial [Escherichia coli]|nr:hypothetical protein [Escherichia coli]